MKEYKHLKKNYYQIRLFYRAKIRIGDKFFPLGLGGGLFLKNLVFTKPNSPKPSPNRENIVQISNILAESKKNSVTKKEIKARNIITKNLFFKPLQAYHLTLALLLCFLNSCDISNPEEAMPAYLKIEKFDFSTTPEQGADSEQITDVWVFVNDLSLGVYELPATLPSLEVGNQNITIFPVIRENGVRSTPIIYPFYNRFETTLDLIAGEITTIEPTTTYVSNAFFELVEDFNMSGHLLKGENPNAVKTVNGTGQILLGEADVIEFTSTGTFIDLPTNNGLSVFLEFDYQTNVEFEVGLVGLDPNPISPVDATVYNVVLCPINRWNKIYINLQDILENSQLPGYKLAFRASINDTGCGGVTNETLEVLIDNVKFIRLTN